MNRGLRRGVGLDSFWTHNNGAPNGLAVSLPAGYSNVPRLDTSAEGAIDFGQSENPATPFYFMGNTQGLAAGTLNVNGAITSENAALQLNFIATNLGAPSRLDLRATGAGSVAGNYVAQSSGDVLAGWNVGGAVRATGFADVAAIECVAAENYNSTSWGSSWNVKTTPTGGGSPAKNIVATFGADQSFTNFGQANLANAFTVGTQTASYTLSTIGTSTTATMSTNNSLNLTVHQVNGSYTVGASSAILQNVLGVVLAPTITSNTSQVVGMWTGFSDLATVQANTGSASIFGGSAVSFSASPTLLVQDAHNQTVSSYAAYQSGLALAPQGASGTLTVTTLTQFNASTITVPANSTVTTFKSLNVAAPTVNGAVGTYVGVDISGMSAGSLANVTTAIGLRCTPPIVYPTTTFTCTSNAATVTPTCSHAKVTNSSAAGCTITLGTSGATDGQELRVRFFDASAVSQTVTFTNSETGKAGAPPASLGSTTIPTTYRFIYNSGTSKWTYCSE